MSQQEEQEESGSNFRHSIRLKFDELHQKLTQANIYIREIAESKQTIARNFAEIVELSIENAKGLVALGKLISCAICTDGELVDLSSSAESTESNDDSSSYKDQLEQLTEMLSQDVLEKPNDHSQDHSNETSQP